MKTVIDFLEICKRKKGFNKDSELAQYLAINKSCISVIRKGGGLSKDTAIKLSNGTGEPLEVIWLASLAQKEQDPIFREALEKISKLSGVAASFFIVFQVVTTFLRLYDYTVCILCLINEYLYTSKEKNITKNMVF